MLLENKGRTDQSESQDLLALEPDKDRPGLDRERYCTNTRPDQIKPIAANPRSRARVKTIIASKNAMATAMTFQMD